ncbi:MAG: hypothetical protein JWM80_706 [Cyanobacteria bacterium RYN_339]|nr:hypothetical protein [Cyanobacteria bacterium RYN_339]
MAADEHDLRERLGVALVQDFLAAAGQVGRSYMVGDEDLVFGFLQRVLAHLKRDDKNYGLIFPKFDERYKRMYDYFDGGGRIVVIRPGEDLVIDPAWTRPKEGYFEVTEGAETQIVLAFLAAYARLLRTS